MRFLLNSRHTLAKELVPLPQLSSSCLPEKLHQPLDLWYIRPHDRQTLIDRIMPFMLRSISKEHLLRTVMEKYSWAGELVKSELTEKDGDDNPTCFRQTTAAFWTNPTSTILDLLYLTRLWFFLLLRYTYRKRICESRESSRGLLDVQDLCTFRCECYSELTEDATRRLIGLPKQYGASFYRGSYKDTKRRLGWTSFCERIKTFCQSIGLHTSSNNPEKNLRDLRHNLTPIIMHREWSYVTNRLSKEAMFVRNIRKDVKKLDERVASGAMHNVQSMKEMERVVSDLNLQIDGLQQKPRQMDIELSAKLNTFCTAYERRLRELDLGIRHNDETCKQLVRPLQKGLEKLPVVSCSLQAREVGCMTAEALLLCRWLLEHLPTAHTKQEGLGHHWKQFWQIHWNQCKNDPKRKSHPLWELVSEERYNKVGKKLYNTLSNRLHKYGHQLRDKLDPDVQRVVDVIKPVCYDTSGKIDLQAERKRWSV